MRKSLAAVLTLILAGTLLAGCAAAPAAETTAADEPAETVSDAGDSAKTEKSDKKSAIKNKKKLSKKGSAKDKDKDSEEDYEQIYAPVLQEVSNLIETGPEYESDSGLDLTGIWERVAYPEDDDLMETIGYVIMDINDDKVPELLIGENAAYEYESPEEVAYIYNGFTCENGKPVSFLEGWARNRQHYLGNGHFFNFGSGGAANTIFGEWHLGADNKEEWDDMFFSEEDAATGNLVIFHNTNGSMDRNDSEKTDMSEDEFLDLQDAYECETISWIPMEDWKKTSGKGVASDNAGSATGYDTAGDGIEYDGSLDNMSGDAYGVFLGAFKDRDKCEPLEAKLEEAGYMYEPVVYTPDFANLNPEPYYVVTAGLYSTKQQAEEVLSDVKAAGFGDAYVKYAGEYIGGRYEYTMYSEDNIEILKDCIILHDVDVSLPYAVGDGPKKADLIVDMDTVFDKSADMQFFGNYEKGMSPYEWIVKNDNLLHDDTDAYMSSGPALIGVFEVSLDGNHIKAYYGSYWWD